ncbi:Rna/Rnp Complex-1-Interacting Phosphatase [Manis pentadactyla]|nr:Rna/Rnp Complex-1-Interacting Phosphatase [Manis pentadactyla]
MRAPRAVPHAQQQEPRRCGVKCSVGNPVVAEGAGPAALSLLALRGHGRHLGAQRSQWHRARHRWGQRRVFSGRPCGKRKGAGHAPESEPVFLETLLSSISYLIKSPSSDLCPEYLLSLSSLLHQHPNIELA